ncbi:hypothetical protein V6N13_086604 [Hibiscus sabdariffa]
MIKDRFEPSFYPNRTRIGRERLAINHLFFADDSILFGEATVDSARHVKTIIDQYTSALGQHVNFDKSLLFFSSNDPSHLKDAIDFNLGARISSNPEKYLGLPTMVGRRKKEAFCYFLDRYTKVADLINPASHTWDIDLIQTLFTASAADRILCIPLAVTKPPDELVWGIEGSELHSVATLSLPSTPTPSSSWSPPAQGIIKFNFDTSLTIATKEAYPGVIARNSQGLIMDACVLHHSAVNDAFIAEARACEAAVNFAIELGFRSIHVEGDSLSVIKKLSSLYVDKSIISLIISDIKYKLIFFEKINLSHVGCWGNEVAHLLAQAHNRFHLPQYWIEDAPLEVEQAALRDFQQ